MRKARPPKIMFFVTEDWYFWSHRLPIAGAARDAGFEVSVVCRAGGHRERIENEGFKVISINLARGSKNVFKEAISILKIIAIYNKEQPDLVHHVAIKPVVYGSWGARIVGISHVVNALPGLTEVFHRQKWKSKIIKVLINFAYRTAFLAKNSHCIFQNKDDLKSLVDSGIIKRERAVLIPGSGVDIYRFRCVPAPKGVPVVLFASRILWNKGVSELVEVAKLFRQEKVQCRIALVGKPDPENPVSVSEELLQEWHSKGLVEWSGYRTDMPSVLSRSHIVVLPSHGGEGIPKVLCEAAACGRPLVATDVPGCREIVFDGENGLLVPPKNPVALANAIKGLVRNPELRQKMGARGREIAVAGYSEEIVVKQTMKLYMRILAKRVNPIYTHLTNYP